MQFYINVLFSCVRVTDISYEIIYKFVGGWVGGGGVTSAFYGWASLNKNPPLRCLKSTTEFRK
jgi:hypothetical protein